MWRRGEEVGVGRCDRGWMRRCGLGGGWRGGRLYTLIPEPHTLSPEPQTLNPDLGRSFILAAGERLVGFAEQVALEFR